MQGISRQHLRRKAIVSSVLLWCLIVVPAAAAFEEQWNIREIIRAETDYVELAGRDGKVLKRASMQQLRVLYAVKSSIEQVAEIEVEMIIVDGDEPNAFAGRGNGERDVIGINFAMLDMIGLDVHAAAAMIGHEIAHLVLHHPQKSKRRAAGTGIARILGGMVLGALGIPGGGLVSDLAFTALDTNYSRDAERDADYLGAIWSVEAGYEVDGAVRLHTMLYELNKGQGVPFLSSHPSGPERIMTLKALSKRLSREPASAPATLP